MCQYIYVDLETLGRGRAGGAAIFSYLEPPTISPRKRNGEIEEDGSQLGLGSASISFNQLWNPEHLESSNHPLLSPQPEIPLGRMACQ